VTAKERLLVKQALLRSQQTGMDS